MLCLALELVGPCVVLGFSVGMEAFDELLLINVPWSQDSLPLGHLHIDKPSFINLQTNRSNTL